MRILRVNLAVLAACAGAIIADAGAQPARAQQFTRADTLRGSISPERAWWDVTYYDLDVRINPADSSIRGSNAITYRVIGAPRDLQIDLQVPLQVDSVLQDGVKLAYRRDGNAFFVTPSVQQRTGDQKTVTVYYRGKPKVAVRPPWDGGFIWSRDSLGNPWVSTCRWHVRRIWICRRGCPWK